MYVKIKSVSKDRTGRCRIYFVDKYGNFGTYTIPCYKVWYYKLMQFKDKLDDEDGEQ